MASPGVVVVVNSRGPARLGSFAVVELNNRLMMLEREAEADSGKRGDKPGGGKWYELFSRGARDWLRHDEKVREAVFAILGDVEGASVLDLFAGSGAMGFGKTFERGSGAYLFAKDGTRYLDFIAGISIGSVGHCHPHYVDALKRQVERLTFGSFVVGSSNAFAHAGCRRQQPVRNGHAGVRPSSASFTGVGTDGDGTVVGFQWDFGDPGSGLWSVSGVPKNGALGASADSRSTQPGIWSRTGRPPRSALKARKSFQSHFESSSTRKTCAATAWISSGSPASTRRTRRAAGGRAGQSRRPGRQGARGGRHAGGVPSAVGE